MAFLHLLQTGVIGIGIELDRYIGFVDPGVNIVNDVLEHHRNVDAAGAAKEGRVTRDVLAHAPEDAGICRLRRAGAEDLDAFDPDGGDAIVLIAGAGDGEVENDAGPWGWASARRGEDGGGRRETIGVCEVVLEDGDGAGGDISGREEGREGGVNVFLRLRRSDVGGEEEAVGEREGRTRRPEKGKEKERGGTGFEHRRGFSSGEAELQCFY